MGHDAVIRRTSVEPLVLNINPSILAPLVLNSNLPSAGHDPDALVSTDSGVQIPVSGTAELSFSEDGHDPVL